MSKEIHVMTKTKFFVFIVAMMCIFFAIPSFTATSTPSSSTTHTPINISGNAELDAFCAGDGTDGLSWETAHVIENYEIDGGSDYAIKIKNTDRFLIIRGCTLSSAKMDAGPLHITTSGNITIRDCTLTKRSDYLIAMGGCSYVNICDNTLTDANFGFFSFGANTNITIDGNEFDSIKSFIIYFSLTCGSKIINNKGITDGPYAICFYVGCHYNEVAFNCFKSTADTYEGLIGFWDGDPPVSVDAGNNYVHNNGCRLISGYSWIIIAASGVGTASILGFIVYRRKRKHN